MVWIPGGMFRMGSANFYPEERPVHDVTVDGFWMDRDEVTNDQFVRFVTATAYA
jgi:formylglycine-generating enzyme